MKLPINIEELLGGRAVEGDRIEYKTGWNPDAIYRSICAFANDFDDTGGGYIVVGVAEKNGRPIRPVVGIEPDQVEPIEKEMVGFNNLMRPYYQPRLYVEEADGKTILVIKVSPGERRPYKIPDNVTAKQKTYNYYIRYNSSSIVPKDEYERELINLANRTPFDDRGNDQITLKDISPLLLHDYLVKVKSSLADVPLTENMESVLEQMELLEPVPEGWRIKNVAAMMFAERPDRFFKQAQVDIVLFPEGRERNPNNLIEVEPVRGSVPTMIEKTLSYLRTNVIKKKIVKPKDDEHSDKFYNYPYQALEEAVVNSLYHRDWTIREPVEITIEPDRISILNFSGPDHTIPMEAVREAKSLRSRRYRNRRLGEFLKELNLTEGRATGIPTIQEELKANGSPKATIETDDERTYFLIDIPCHPVFVNEKVILNKDVVKDVVKDVIKDVIKEFGVELSERQTIILEMICLDSSISAKAMSEKISEKDSVDERTIQRDLSKLKKIGILIRKGGRKNGEWEIVTNRS
ncbi:MAG: putative DNA binding domain-containing protein [Bacteroidaceae bacterium]|nr:putative DNA binding domain-containing protein [Bacteroidaceae bacterium]